VRSRRDILIDLLILFAGVVALALPPMVVKFIERSATASVSGELTVFKPAGIPSDTDVLTRKYFQVEEENRRLKDSVRRMDEFRSLTSRIGMPADSWVNAVVVGARREAGRWRYLIDVGTRDGVQSGAGVVLGYAVLGIVESVTADSAWVLRIDAPPCKAPALIPRSGAEGLLEANGDGLFLSYGTVGKNPENPPVMVGELVMTSGRAGVFPPGVVVGQVKGVGYSEDGLFHIIEVETELPYIRGDVVAVWKKPAPRTGGTGEE